VSGATLVRMTRIELNNTEESPAWKPDAHCLALDGIRGLAILAVTLYRLCKELDPEAQPVLATIRRFAPVGERGVDLFFVLSGFLITGILLRTKSQPHYFRNFMMRRVLRIFPLYFLSLVVGLLVVPNLFSTKAFDLASREQLYLWTYTSNLRMAWVNEWCFGAFDHFWSLAVEEHFYLIWPAVVLFLTRRHLAYFCIAIIVGVGIARTITAMDSRFDIAVSVATYFRADGLSFGALLALLLTSAMDKKAIRRAAWITIAVLLPVLAGVAVSGKRLLEIPSTLCPAICFAGMAIVLLSHRHAALVKLFEWRWLRALGKYSYGMYVIQLPMVTLIPMALVTNVLPTEPLLQAAIYIACMLALIYFFALASFQCFESHFLRLKALFHSTPVPRKSNPIS
jgi:peptidoglycan/LPS O-acetylase OafA/YrhL